MGEAIIKEPCICVQRRDGPEGCGVCNETGIRDRGPMRPLLFHREGFFYPIDLPLYDDLSAHAECNPGTLKITDALTGEILWRPQ